MTKGTKLDLEDINLPQDKCIPQETVIKNVRLAAAYKNYAHFYALLKPLNTELYFLSFIALMKEKKKK
jgi:hypothetical protein